jgi:hypothetical protein
LPKRGLSVSRAGDGSTPRTERQIVELLKRHGISVDLGAQYSIRCQFGQLCNAIQEVEQESNKDYTEGRK